MQPSQPIAVFDSGLGGLSVVRHLRQVLPDENIVYFGDTARVPYGSKSRRTVARFAREACRLLLQSDPKLIVAACNTVSALALDDVAPELPVPLVGVVAPGARAAVERAAGRPIAVIGTEATIASDAYPVAIRALLPGADVRGVACPLFVPLVEEGRDGDDPLVQMAVRDYLRDLAGQIGVIVLGCTHYPLLRDAIAAFLGDGVDVVDSGRETALTVQAALRHTGGLSRSAQRGSMRCCVSDNPTRFRRIGSRFLNEEIDIVESVEPERYVSSPVSD